MPDKYLGVGHIGYVGIPHPGGVGYLTNTLESVGYLAT
jgi:hypothetical protein